jgi:hypothetical protein
MYILVKDNYDKKFKNEMDNSLYDVLIFLYIINHNYNKVNFYFIKIM